VEEIVPTTEELSELLDATMLVPQLDEGQDEVSELPPPSSPVKRAASRRSSRAPSLTHERRTSRRSSRAPSLPAVADLTPAVKPNTSLVPPATVPVKLAARAVEIDAGPESDPAFFEDTVGGVADDSVFMPEDDSMIDDTFADLPAATNGDDNDDGRVGRTYGGDFEYGDSSMVDSSAL
jgi:hypothetical protein